MQKDSLAVFTTDKIYDLTITLTVVSSVETHAHVPQRSVQQCL